jgi:hypothetical protein
MSIQAYLPLLVILSSYARVRTYYHLVTATFDIRVHTVKSLLSIFIERNNTAALSLNFVRNLCSSDRA